MQRLVRKEGTASWRARPVLRGGALLLAVGVFAASLGFAALSPRSALAGWLGEGSYVVRVAMPDIPEALRNGLSLRQDIPDLAVPPELAETSEEGLAEPAAREPTDAPPVAAPAENRADFVESFSDLAAGTAAPRRPPAGTNGDAMLQLDYDLVAGPGSDGSVQISRDLRRGSASLGALTLQIDRNAALYASRADLVRMLPTRAAQLQRLDGEFVPLSRLRQAGVNLRYDAARDELMLLD